MCYPASSPAISFASTSTSSQHSNTNQRPSLANIRTRSSFLHCNEMTTTTTPPTTPSFLALPAELRLLCYELVVDDDLHQFAASFRKPSLLHVCRQLRNEYAGVFFNGVTIDSYYHETACWVPVSGKAAKMAIVEQCKFTHLVSYSSLASAQRYCERGFFSCSNQQRGILTVANGSNASLRWWQWSIKA